MVNFFCLKFKKSLIGIKKKNKFILKSLGFKGLNSTVKLVNNSINRGKVKKIFNFVKIYLC